MLLALVGLALLAFVLLQVVRDLSSRGRIAGVPARNGLPLLGCALDFAGNPAAFLQETRRQLGDSFVVRIMMVDMFFVFSATGASWPGVLREAQTGRCREESEGGAMGLCIGQGWQPEAARAASQHCLFPHHTQSCPH